MASMNPTNELNADDRRETELTIDLEIADRQLAHAIDRLREAQLENEGQAMVDQRYWEFKVAQARLDARRVAFLICGLPIPTI